MHRTQFDELAATVIEIEKIYERWADELGVHIHYLHIFYTLTELGQCTQKQISEQWLIPKQTLSPLCKQLHQQGYLAFLPSRDKREKLLTLTDDGKHYAEPLIAFISKKEARIMTAFGDERLSNLCKELGELLGEMKANDA